MRITEVTETEALPRHKDIPSRERLIVPLDVPSVEEARELVTTLGDSAHFYKVGLELLLAAGGYARLMDWLVQRQKKVMLDLKIYDVPRTTAAAVRQLAGQGVTFVTVHGTDEILRAAVDARAGEVKVLAVTVLTSFDEKDLEDLGFPVGTRVAEVVLNRAKRALSIGCDGVISSGLEAPQLRASLGDNFLIVVPGVRPGANLEIEEVPGYLDDQKRVVDVAQAFQNGADYIVVGRPIRRADDKRAAAELIQGQIEAFFAEEAKARR